MLIATPLSRIWDTSTGQCLRTLLLLNEDNPAVTNVCFSPNGRYVLAFNLDSCVRLWDYIPHPSTVKKTYQGHRNAAFSVGGCFGTLRDGAGFVAAASEDGDLVLWDVGSKEVVQRIRAAHAGVCFWVDVCGPTLVSCGKDGRVVVFRDEAGAADDGDGDGDGTKADRAVLAGNGVPADGGESAGASTYHTPEEGPGGEPIREDLELL